MSALGLRVFSVLAAAALLGGAFSLPAGAQWPASGSALNLGGRSAASASSVVSTPEVRAELLAHAPRGVAAGQPVWLGLQLAHQPEWHTYWKNPGDSGLPTVLEWTLPAGVTAGDVAWPTPKKIPIGNLANYGYEGTVLLPVPVTVAPGFAGDKLEIKLKASWLVCRKECIPQEGEFALSVPVRSSSAGAGAAFEAAFAASPRALKGGSSQIEVDVTAKALRVSVAGLPAALQGKTLAFFPETGGVTEPAAAMAQSWQGALWTAQVPLSAQRSESPAVLPVVLAPAQGADAGRQAWRIDLPVKGDWPPVAPPVAVPAALEAALKANTAPTTPTAPLNAPAGPPLGWLAALLGAFVGGLILNLMPCVFPVLAIKMVSFVQIKERADRLRSGTAYTAGVVLSFLALGALLLGLRAAGEQLGWGFQLQSPAVVAALAALFTLLGLNLAGLFEFGQLLPSRLASLQAKNPTIDAFLSGVLATAVASPCTAPFMGASLGLALGLPAVQALSVFGAIGLGMALPYALASAVPAVARAMPRPGAWMLGFRQLMAFPMFATVVWLVWVLGQQSGIDGAGALLGLLVLLALLVWALTLTGRPRTVAVVLALVLLLWALSWLGPQVVKPMTSGPAQAGASGERWQPWAPGRVEQLTAEGRSVMVDFTAAWCVTCQYNKQNALADSAVLADMAAKNVALLRADWTRRDPAVTAALQALGRSGVPVYVIYQPGKPAVVLSEILTVDDLRRALAPL
jgi:thiol:disulfide interchange protein DsbD